MGDFADDYSQNDNSDFNFDNSPIMCTGCGEIVREKDIRFENGKSCCIKCE